MAEVKVKTLLIDKLMTATGSVTDNYGFNLLLLPEAEGIITRGQVISLFGTSDMGWNPNGQPRP